MNTDLAIDDTHTHAQVVRGRNVVLRAECTCAFVADLSNDLINNKNPTDLLSI